MVTTGKETDGHRRGNLGVRPELIDHPSCSSSFLLQSSLTEGSQSLKATPQEKARTIPGSAVATSVALCFKVPKVTTKGHKTHKGHKNQKSKVPKVTQTEKNKKNLFE